MNIKLLNYKKACNLISTYIKTKPAIMLNSISTNLSMIEKCFKSSNKKKE